MLGRTESVLTGNITNWCGVRTEQDIEAQQWVIKTARHINGSIHRAVISIR